MCVRVKSAALCGTDLHVLDWNLWARNAGMKLPFVMGHECCGDVVAVITHSMPLSRWQEGVELAKSGQACKVIYHP